MKNPKLGDFILWDGKPAKIVYESTGRKVGIELLENCKCPHCNGDLGKKQIDVIVASPQFQNNAMPIQTMGDNTNDK